MGPTAWRERENLTLKEAAKRLGVSSASCVFRYERGERETPNSVTMAYARESGGEVTAEDLHRARKRFLRAQERSAA
jgi:transcriptional regulator with XRE-family HTH domain